MNCCENCFNSQYIKQVIQTNSNEVGTCSFCNSSDVKLYVPNKLSIYFRNLVELYIPVDRLSSGLIPSPIETQIVDDFPNKIFNIDDHIAIKRLLINIIDDQNSEYEDILNKTVYLNCLIDPVRKEQAEILQVSWEEFVKEIKTENRYHLNHIIDLQKLKKLLRRHEKEYIKGKNFFRTRISSTTTFSTNEMLNPPAEKASAGRANPEGISYLYLSGDIQTTLYETRAYLFDYVSIGEFSLKENITIVNLSETENYDPMQLADAEELDDFLIHLPFISHLEKELSKPMRRTDNKLDYISTQYLSEFIKSLNYDGIEYASSLHPDGYNIAIFNPEKIECIKVSLEEINKISFEHKLV